VERSQNEIGSVWPEPGVVLSYEPNSLVARRALAGQLYAESSGGLDKKIKDTGLQSNPSAETLQAIEAAYQEMLGDETRPGRGLNGASAMLLVRALTESGERRVILERTAQSGFFSAIAQGSGEWQYTYNWSLADLIVGDYAEAYEALQTIKDKAIQDGEYLVPFWLGVAALRMGNPVDAQNQFQSAIDAKTPQGANQALENLYAQVRDLSREGLGDAQWAWQQPAEAYNTYFTLLQLGSGGPGLYSKWLRLGLQQHAYEKLASDLAELATTSSLGKEPRVHHDRARLLSFLGREAEADMEYQQALQLGQSDPALLISYGQSLESRGNHEGAIFQAEEAIRKLGQKPEAPDMAEVARAVTTGTTTVAKTQASQQLLDANLLRARAYARQGNLGTVDSLVANMSQQAGSLPANQSGLVSLYGAFAYEAAGQPSKARDNYQAAWDKLKDLPDGSSGRAAALAGLARESAAAGAGAQDGLNVLKGNGYDPQALTAAVSQDTDAPDILNQEVLLLTQAGQAKEAANMQRVVAIVRNLQDARQLTGVGRPIWRNTGTVAPASSLVAAGDSELAVAGGNDQLAAMRYKQAAALDPALPTAWNNLGVLYAQTGKADLANFYLSASSKVSPAYALGQHNVATFAYSRGDYFTAEAAQGQAIKALGPQTLYWGYDLRADNRGLLPAPSPFNSDFLGRLPAILIVLLLVAHTLVGNDRLTNRMGLVPTRGVLGRVSAYVDERTRAIAPNLVAARSDMMGVAVAVAIPSLVGMLALAWASAHGSFGVIWVFLPVALLVSLIAFGANELTQYLVARRSAGGTMGSTVHHLWPLGVAIGVLSIPFGFLYGWQNVTRVQPAASTEGAAVGRTGVIGRRTRTTEDADLAYEAQAEAAAEDDGRGGPAGAPTLTGASSAGMLRLNTAGQIFFAGLAANLIIGLLFAAVYWATGWPSMRLGMFASMLVLAFTSVSEPPADGWTIYRRNKPLWLALFVFASAMSVLIATGII
jgi:Tfp pilus assembly protein PilF